VRWEESELILLVELRAVVSVANWDRLGVVVVSGVGVDATD